MWMNAGMMVLIIISRKEYAPDFIFTRFELPHWRQIGELARLGVPMSSSWFMEASLFGVVALLMGRMGTTVVAGHQIAINVASITFMVPLGVAMATTVRVGHATGRGDKESARLAGFAGISLAAAFMACCAIGIASFPRLIASIYTNEPDVQQMGITLLYLAAVFQISDGLQVAAAGALRGLKDTKTPMVITAIAYWLVAIPLGYMLGIVLNGGPKALWVGIICGLAVAALLLNLRFHFATRPAKVVASAR
jgi:MATE family multidrug resistance protein